MPLNMSDSDRQNTYQRVNNSRNALDEAFKLYFGENGNIVARFNIDTNIHHAVEKEYYETLDQKNTSIGWDSYVLWANIVIKKNELWTQILVNEHNKKNDLPTF
jgi:hypothetical protein